ncbi:unnamed protein product [Adineta ricciae]|uniref:B box-type domain-containing protein n=1 Tax=Adineta ricciae TaxID=249248 RepID=A0A815KYF4_ADIRI|nr:unnamed protein product [Adineta ricciae]
MSSSIRTCAITKCENSSFALCNCCQELICIDHLKVHSDQCNAQLLPIADEVNQLLERLNEVNSTELICVKQLEEWRQAAHRLVDSFCEQKRHALLNRVHKREREKLDNCRGKLNELIRKKGGTPENIESLRNDIRLIEQNLNELKHFQLELQPLVIDSDLITIPRLNQNILQLSIPDKKIECVSPHFYLLASNDQYLLADIGTALCLLDLDLNIVKEIDFTYGSIWDMFWSSKISRFFVMTKNRILTFDIVTMSIQLCGIPCDSDSLWTRGTCSDASLYLSAISNEDSAFIHEFTLPLTSFVRTHRLPSSSNVGNSIRDIKFRSDSFIIIRGDWKPHSATCLELRSAITLDCLWSVPIDTAGRCYYMNKNNWIVVDYYKEQLLRISMDGAIVEQSKYVPGPTDVLPWNDDLLIVRTAKQINLHVLQ